MREGLWLIDEVKMKFKYQKLFLFLTYSIFLCSCSYRVSFIIENRSNSNIAIKYQTKNLYYGDLVPRVKSLNDINNREILWEILSEEKYKIDKEKGIVELNLSPNQGFELTTADPFWTHHEPYGDHFNIKTLSISGENGSIEIKGNQVFEIFEAQKVRFNFFGPNVGGYILRYKESETHEITNKN